MGLGYSITTTINLPFDLQNIKLILKKGLSLGFTYHELIVKNGEKCELRDLSIDNILHLIQHALINNDVYTIRISNIISSDIIFFSNEGFLSLMLLGMSPEQSKKYLDGEIDIDIHHYAHVLLNLVDEFKILDMKIEND